MLLLLQLTKRRNTKQQYARYACCLQVGVAVSPWGLSPWLQARRAPEERLGAHAGSHALCLRNLCAANVTQDC